MNEATKSFLVGMFVGACLCFLCTYTMQSKGTDGATMGTVKQELRRTGTETGNADNEIGKAKDSISTAGTGIRTVQGRIEHSTATATSNADEINQCSDLAKECLRLARENHRIIEASGGEK